jgi:hypothetical protein
MCSTNYANICLDLSFFRKKQTSCTSLKKPTKFQPNFANFGGGRNFFVTEIENPVFNIACPWRSFFQKTNSKLKSFYITMCTPTFEIENRSTQTTFSRLVAFSFKYNIGLQMCRVLSATNLEMVGNITSKVEKAPSKWLLAFSSPNSPQNFTMQKEDSLSHQNVGKCMEY